MDDIEIKDAESRFIFPDLLQSLYFQEYCDCYYSMREGGFQIPPRNYLNLLKFINEIDLYNKNHARSFAKRLHSAQDNWKNSEAIFSEIIVYRYYIRMAYEGHIKAIHLIENDADIILEKSDGIKMYLEVFCVMPDFTMPKKDGKVVVYDVKTHTQNALASIRQKLLRKIQKQNQMSQKRENYAVIELNNSIIADAFTVLSSLSGGYKITIDRKSGEKKDEGYDWSGSIFNDRETNNIKCIIYFSQGDYESRKFIFNPIYSA